MQMAFYSISARGDAGLQEDLNLRATMFKYKEARILEVSRNLIVSLDIMEDFIQIKNLWLCLNI